jgi:hypothetical protein
LIYVSVKLDVSQRDCKFRAADDCGDQARRIALYIAKLPDLFPDWLG